MTDIEEICKRAKALYGNHRHLRFGAGWTVFGHRVARSVIGNTTFEQVNSDETFFVYRLNGYSISQWLLLDEWCYVIESDDMLRNAVFFGNGNMTYCLTSTLTEEDEVLLGLML